MTMALYAVFSGFLLELPAAISTGSFDGITRQQVKTFQRKMSTLIEICSVGLVASFVCWYGDGPKQLGSALRFRAHCPGFFF